MRVNYQTLKAMPIVHDARGFPAQSHDMKRLLGVDGKLPAGGMPPREIDGVKVWVLSLAEAKERKQFHRVVCECPKCRQEVSVGRLHQHMMLHVEE